MGNRWFGSFATIALCFGVQSTLAADYVPPSAAVSKINSYRSYKELTTAASGMDLDKYAYNMTTWQISNGGFFKAMADKYKNPYSSGEKSSWRSKAGGDLGTIDNDATVQEMRLLAVRYKETTNSTYKAAFKTSFNKAVNFLLTMQRSSGGLPQVWPKRGNYSDHITLNDNAMIRAMVTMMDIANGSSPFDSDIIDNATRSKMQGAMDKAINYLLKAQIVNNGNLTVWCAQHDTANYAPRPARAYELESKSGSESAGVVWFLMNWPEQTPEIQKAIKGAIAWYKKTKVTGKKFDKKQGAIVNSNGSSMWYRFYEVNNDNYFFCDREGASTKTNDLSKISEERRTGYQWAGDYGSALLSAEAAYLSAIANITPVVVSSSSVPASSSSSDEPASSSSIVIEPATADCGGTTCATVLQGEDFLEIQGKKESSNAGFLGEGYANVDNAVGSFTTYGVTAKTAGKYTVYLRYANGGSAARGFSVSAGDKTLVENGNMEATGAWTSWKTTSVELELPQGYSVLTFKSTGADGMANLDMLGWMSADLLIGKVDITDTNTTDPGETESIGKDAIRKSTPNERYFVDFGNRNSGAGVYLMRHGKKFRVNGAR